MCDWGRPGTDQQLDTVAWQRYGGDDGSVIYGGEPLGAAAAGSGTGWASPSFADWLSAE